MVRPQRKDFKVLWQAVLGEGSWEWGDTLGEEFGRGRGAHGKVIQTENSVFFFFTVAFSISSFDFQTIRG